MIEIHFHGSETFQLYISFFFPLFLFFCLARPFLESLTGHQPPTTNTATLQHTANTTIPSIQVAQYLIKRFAAAANIIDNDEDDFAKERDQIISSIGGIFSKAKSLLGEHKVHDAPKGGMRKKKGGEHME